MEITEPLILVAILAYKETLLISAKARIFSLKLINATNANMCALLFLKINIFVSLKTK